MSTAISAVVSALLQTFSSSIVPANHSPQTGAAVAGTPGGWRRNARARAARCSDLG
jgi:hypothetical protein